MAFDDITQPIPTLAQADETTLEGDVIDAPSPVRIPTGKLRLLSYDADLDSDGS